MPATLRKLNTLLTRRDKVRGLVVLAMMAAMALIETAGVVSVMPFLAVLGNSTVVQSNSVLAWLYAAGGFDSTDSFLFALGVAAFVVVVGASLFRMVAHYAMDRYANMRRHSISARLLQGYLRQPYPFFLDRNTADLAKTLLSEVDQLVMNVIKPGIQLVAYSLVVSVLVLALLIVNPMLALVVAGTIGSVYAVIYIAVRRILARIGRDRVLANQARFTTASEALGGIKDVKVLGRERAYVKRFEGPSIRFSSHQAVNDVLAVVPRYLMEAIGFGTVLVLTLVLMETRRDLGQVLPILGLYAFAGFRLLPAAHKVYESLSKLRFGLPALDGVYEDLKRQPAESAAVPTEGPLPLEQGIRFDRVTFFYPNRDLPALRDLILEIPVNTTVGFVGGTGAGKTTAVDLILGLLEPSEGRILVDGRPITAATKRRWAMNIGYVPQNIYLADATVAENIAFGIEPEDIDRRAVECAARVANLHRFVTTELPQGYDTVVGERGVRLSGGQRQRIGIARALYHDPDVLVLDEATSALDNATERAIMDAVHRLSHRKTIIIIAHRLSTVVRCDQIFVLDAGVLAGVGRYDDLSGTNDAFRRIAVA